MLNIGNNSINHRVDQSQYSSFKILAEKSVSSYLLRFIFIMILLAMVSLLLPWTQNIRSKGYVTTFNPYDRPQSVQSLIDGRIEDWFIREGDLVHAGDTILIISESKADYLDPEIIARTSRQVDAKNQSVNAYEEKAKNLDQQLLALNSGLEAKLEQNKVKIEQTKIKMKSDSIDLVAAVLKLDNATKQLERTKFLNQKGLKSITDVEIKELSKQEAEAKLVGIKNKLAAGRNDLANLNYNAQTILNDFESKIAKSKAERMSTLSNKFNAEGSVDKLKSSLSKLQVRSDNYIVRAPIDGYITKINRQGIGEFVKAGEDILSIVPANHELAVEMYVEPVDVPLLQKEQKVRIQFDGWPAIVFSGWPNNSYGTFSGKIYAIENFISDNGMYRVLVKQDDEAEAWPSLLRVGGGTNSIILLNEVSLYYEIWRKLNGFPADFYDKNENKNIKLKAPIRKVK